MFRSSLAAPSAVQLLLALSLTIGGVTGSPLAFAGATPANDECANATTLTLGLKPFSNVGATVQLPGVNCSSIGADVWFKFQSTFNGPLQISTCGTVDFDSVIAVYSGCDCGTFTLLGCSDDAVGCTGQTSKLTVTVTAGTCYRIRVGGFQADQGTGILTLTVTNEENAAAADVVLTGDEPGDKFGTSVAGKAKLTTGNNDDVLVGAPLSDILGSNSGRAFSFSGPNLEPLETVNGEAAANQLGFSVATDCDVNDDGFDDLVIGAPYNDEFATDAGRVYAISGFDNSVLWEFSGVAAGDRLGHCVACAGDVNGDGFDDVIVGAPYHDVSATKVDAGRTYILDGENGAQLDSKKGQTAKDHFGWAVDGIGDFNNDGKDDYVISAPDNDLGGADAGRIYIYSGATGLGLKKMNGDEPGDRFGWSLAGMRFSTPTNFGLLAVGAPFNDEGGSNAGRVKVFLRNITAPTCSGLICPLYTINGGNANDRLGTSVAVGKVVGSSFADIIVSAPLADLNGSKSGTVFVYDGGSGTLARRYFGEAAGDQFGASVAVAGDLDENGNDDLIVGAPLNNAGGADAGRAYVFLLGGAAATASMAAPISPPDAAAVADLNADGAVNSIDLLALISAWGSCPIDGESCPADLAPANGNGIVDVEDLLALIAAFGAAQ